MANASIASPTWTSRLRDSIKGSMLRYTLEDDFKYFITHQDLISAWNEETDNGTPLNLLRQSSDHFSSMSDEVFNDHWIRVVSILIWIEHDEWLEFVQDSLNWTWRTSGPQSEHSIKATQNEGASATFQDEHLPFTKDVLKSYLFKDSETEVEVAMKFFEAQFAFKPISLQQGKLLDFDDDLYRLPIKEEQDPNHTGAYGFVTKVKIAGNHYLYRTEISAKIESYPNDFYAARKEFDVDYDFAREHENLKILRSNDLQHSRIMQSFASVIVGRTYSLFFPWADLDLGRFLDGEYTPDYHEEIITPHAMMREALNLLDALQFLHESVKINGVNVVFSHLDLKPNNILVTKDDDVSSYPVGKWKIADFGISSTEPRQDETSMPVSTRELFQSTNRSESQTNSVVDLDRYPGPYQPPEAEQPIAEWFKQNKIKTPGDESDVWSYGCILLSILAFAIGGSRYIQILNQKRLEGGICPDGEQRKGYFYRRANGHELQLHEPIRSWFDGDLSKNRDWSANTWKIIAAKMLQIYPNRRKSAKDVSAELKPLVDDGMPRVNIWSESSSDPAHDSAKGKLVSRPKSSRSLSNSRSPESPSETPIPQSISREQQSIPELSRLYLDVSQLNKKVVDLSVTNAKTVKCSSDGTSILYGTRECAVAFQLSGKDGGAVLTAHKSREMPASGQAGWTETSISGNYVALHTTTDSHGMGKVELHDLSAADVQDQSRLAKHIDNEHVNGISVSVDGTLAVRYARNVSLFTLSGDPVHPTLTKTLDKLQDRVNAITFDPSGQIFFAAMSDHCLIHNLADNSEPLILKHKFRRLEHGYFSPSIIPFTKSNAFLLHDAAEPGRCLAILPGLGTSLPLREYRFTLSGKSPEAIVITPDGKMLLYVTVHKSKLRRKHTYTLRSRAIEVKGRCPITADDIWQTDIFEFKEKLDVSIAAISTSTGYAVLVAVITGEVHAFAVEQCIGS